MFPAPPGANSRRAGFTLLEVLVVVGIIAVLSGLVLGVGRRAVESGKVARAKGELTALTAALGTYRRNYGDYPQTDEAARLLQSLLGRRSPLNQAITGPAFIEAAKFTTAGSLDPFANESAVLVDPWDQPYVYAYKSQVPWHNPGFVLYSIGPDGADMPTLLTGGLIDPAPAANADNLYANR